VRFELQNNRGQSAEVMVLRGGTRPSYISLRSLDIHLVWRFCLRSPEILARRDGHFGMLVRTFQPHPEVPAESLASSHLGINVVRSLAHPSPG
jgi:hypothetical protein